MEEYQDSVERSAPIAELDRICSIAVRQQD